MSTPSAPVPPAPSTGPLTVLVVDDNPDAAASTAEVLALYGHRALCATDGAGALEVAAADPPDAAVLDLMMPRMNGVELARRLRGAGGRRPVLVALTGWRGSAVERWAAEGGFDAVLFKPAEPAALLAALLAGRPADGDGS
jgi:CheY-like chemotaxis protein